MSVGKLLHVTIIENCKYFLIGTVRDPIGRNDNDSVRIMNRKIISLIYQCLCI